MIRVFLAGIMQGSKARKGIHRQDYRQRLQRAIEAHVPGVEVYCPWTHHQQSVDYGDDHGKGVFLRHNRMAAEMDVLVAYLPEASMGTAVEMWEAYRHGRIVISISPMSRNWTVRYLSRAIYPDLAAFEEAAQSGELARVMASGEQNPAGAD